jgi:hypothetical protein
MNHPSLRTPEQEVVRKAREAIGKRGAAVIALHEVEDIEALNHAGLGAFAHGKVSLITPKLPRAREAVCGEYPIIPYNVTNPEVLELIRVHNMMLGGAWHTRPRNVSPGRARTGITTTRPNRGATPMATMIEALRTIPKEHYEALYRNNDFGYTIEGDDAIAKLLSNGWAAANGLANVSGNVVRQYRHELGMVSRVSRSRSQSDDDFQWSDDPVIAELQMVNAKLQRIIRFIESRPLESPLHPQGQPAGPRLFDGEE